jgi:hypothetical protein
MVALHGLGEHRVAKFTIRFRSRIMAQLGNASSRANNGQPVGLAITSPIAARLFMRRD